MVSADTTEGVFVVVVPVANDDDDADADVIKGSRSASAFERSFSRDEGVQSTSSSSSLLFLLS
jgi:hypothetical protein